MAKFTGDLMVVKYGTLDISGQARALEVDEQANEIDVTTYGSTDAEFIVGMTSRTFQFECLDDDTVGSATRAALKVGTANSLTWFPLGTAAGKPKFTVGTAVVLQNNKTYPFDDAVLIAVQGRLSGAVAETAAP